MPIGWLFESLILVTVGILHDSLIMYLCYASCYVIKFFDDDDDDDDDYSRKFGSSLNTSKLF